MKSLPPFLVGLILGVAFSPLLDWLRENVR
jgi:predicted PurR-regulated permease PerM